MMDNGVFTSIPSTGSWRKICTETNMKAAIAGILKSFSGQRWNTSASHPHPTHSKALKKNPSESVFCSPKSAIHALLTPIPVWRPVVHYLVNHTDGTMMCNLLKLEGTPPLDSQQEKCLCHPGSNVETQRRTPPVCCRKKRRLRMWCIIGTFKF